MIKLSKYKEEVDYYTEKASAAIRALAFAGIAAIWVFKVADANGQPAIARPLITPLVFFVSALGVDLLQYLFASIVYDRLYFLRSRDVEGDLDARVEGHSPTWPTIINGLFYVKAALTFLGFVFFLRYVALTWSILPAHP